MNLLIGFLIGIGLAVLICIIIKLTTRVKDEEDIISQSRSVGSKFNECCIKKIKGMWGGGA